MSTIEQSVPQSTRSVQPRWVRWAPPAVGVWALAYGTLRVVWAVGDPPDDMSPIGVDLLIGGWWSVLLCGTAAALAAALAAGSRTSTRVPTSSSAARRTLVPTSALVTATLAMSSALLLLDAVGGVLPGLGLEFYAVGAASRVGCLTGAVLLAVATVGYSRRVRAACLSCGLAPGRVAARTTPAWAWWGAYAAVAGCLVRVAAQYALFDGGATVSSGYSGGLGVVLFEAGFLLTGVVLPLALVHRWGRRVWRWLLVVPGVGLSAGLVAYFGFGTIQLALDTIRGVDQVWSAAFMWVAVPSYLAWGLGMGAAALAYYATTRPPCRRCGR